MHSEGPFLTSRGLFEGNNLLLTGFTAQISSSMTVITTQEQMRGGGWRAHRVASPMDRTQTERVSNQLTIRSSVAC